MSDTARAEDIVVYTRDDREPIPGAGDPNMEHPFRGVPVPPDNSGDWEIWDDTHDRRMAWIRRSLLLRGGHA